MMQFLCLLIIHIYIKNLVDFTYLYSSQINNNKISWTIEDVRGVFSSLNNLVNFSIASNNIKSVSRNAFKGLTSLVQLDLSNNNITSIQRNAFIEMPLLEVS